MVNSFERSKNIFIREGIKNQLDILGVYYWGLINQINDDTSVFIDDYELQLFEHIGRDPKLIITHFLILLDYLTRNDGFISELIMEAKLKEDEDVC